MNGVRIIDGTGAITPPDSVLVPGLTAPMPDVLTIVAASPAMHQAVEFARKFAARKLPILLIGPTGSGKEVMAQAIHLWSGRRGAMVDVNCGAIPPGMVASALFGHRRGAFTGAVQSVPGLLERAKGGTLFLDELDSLPAEGQTALLRALETGEVRRVGEVEKRAVEFRLVAAIQPGGAVGGLPVLRQDLYHRLAGGVIHLPPLRARVDDIWPLARFFAAHHGRTLGPGAKPLLERYQWPGNVRELRLCLLRAASLVETSCLEAEAIALALDGVASPEGAAPIPRPFLPAELEAQRAALEVLSQKCDGRADAMAAALRVSRATLYRRLQRVGLRLRYGLEEGPAA